MTTTIHPKFFKNNCPCMHERMNEWIQSNLMGASFIHRTERPDDDDDDRTKNAT